MCNSARRYPEDRQAEHPSFLTFLPSVRAVRRKGCKLECEGAGARNFSIPPCCPGFDRGIHVAGQRTPRAGTDRHCVAREFATSVQVLMKPMPDEAAHRCARRETYGARVPLNDRVEVEQAPRSFNTTQKFSRDGSDLNRLHRLPRRRGG